MEIQNWGLKKKLDKKWQLNQLLLLLFEMNIINNFTFLIVFLINCSLININICINISTFLWFFYLQLEYFLRIFFRTFFDYKFRYYRTFSMVQERLRKSTTDGVDCFQIFVTNCEARWWFWFFTFQISGFFRSQKPENIAFPAFATRN